MDGHLLRFDKEKKLTFIDCETYNLCLSFINNRPWQVGLIEVKGDSIIKETDILINWPKRGAYWDWGCCGQNDEI